MSERTGKWLTQEVFLFLVKTGTIQCSEDVSKVVCMSCKLAVELMEKACRAQEILTACFKRR